MEGRWKTLAGVLAGGQLVAAALVEADTPLPLALIIANIPTAIVYGAMHLMGNDR